MNAELEFEKWWEEKFTNPISATLLYDGNAVKAAIKFALAIGRKAGMEEATNIVDPLNGQYDTFGKWYAELIRKQIEVENES